MQFNHNFPSVNSLFERHQLAQLENVFISSYRLVNIYKEVAIDKVIITYHTEDCSKMAAFDISNSNNKIHCFHIYPRFMELIAEELTRIETIILHEIIHSLDHLILFKQHTLAQIETISTQYAFIHFLATIRNEGVAVLIQKLIHKENVKETSSSAFILLENDLNTVLRSCISNTIHQRISWNEFQYILHQLHLRVYNYADVIAFYFINEYVDFSIYVELNDFILNASLQEKKELITHLFEMDVSKWIQQLIKIEQANKIRLEIKLELLIHLCSLLQPKIYKQHYTLLDDIPLYAYRYDKKNVIRILEDFVPKKQDISLIRAHLETVNYTNLSLDNLDLEIIQLCRQLLIHRNDDNMHLIDLALSYYLSKQDIIFDDTLFIGKQDDWIVLESTYILLNLTPTNK
jgi:hypothetical protein